MKTCYNAFIMDIASLNELDIGSRSLQILARVPCNCNEARPDNTPSLGCPECHGSGYILGWIGMFDLRQAEKNS